MIKQVFGSKRFLPGNCRGCRGDSVILAGREHDRVIQGLHGVVRDDEPASKQTLSELEQAEVNAKLIVPLAMPILGGVEQSAER